jgi:membrane complex biogenesis BtpA family protein
MNLQDTFETRTPLVGMVHLPPLPGAPDSDGDREQIRERALADARALAESGLDGVMVENFGDAPFYPDDVPKHVVAEMAALCQEIRTAVDCPLGVNVLRNDATAALSVAAATGGSFLRVNVHTGSASTDQGHLEGRAHETLRLREQINADVAILADIAVKHAAPPDRDIEALAADAIERGLADGVVVSGPTTGERVETSHLDAVLAARDAASRDVPVFLGSGVTADNAADLLARADGAIVGTALKRDGVTTNPVDRERAAKVVAAVEEE